MRIDKEFSDITYSPAGSLREQIDELCKRYNNKKFSEEERKNLLPYYSYEDQKKLFDESSISKMKEIESNPELQKKLQAEMEERKRQERDNIERQRLADE